MENLISTWTNLTAQKKLVAILSVIAIGAMVMSIANMTSKPTMSLLYSGLESGTAGEVVTALEAQGVPFEVRGTSIFVPAAQRDLARMTLASQGLPANGGAGYELLDSLSGFGTTSQMFDAAYWRAKEGELARTIAANQNIRSARVHISTSGNSPFQTNQKATASISVATSGSGLASKHAKALKYLVASAVPGLRPEDVSVIDEQGVLLSSGDEIGAGTGETDRSAEIKARVERLLEARVGYGNAVVEVSLETNTETESLIERTFDPDSRVAISTDVEEQSNSSQGAAGGQVTVASNLPDGEAANGGNTSSQTAQTRERTNFEVSETKREILKSPGAIKRLTVAVLVNGQSVAQADGTLTKTERTPDELQALEELVASAVGLNPERGDVLTIKSMAFEPITNATAGTSSGLMNQMNLDVMSMIQLAVLAVVTLLLGMFVLRPILMNRTASTKPALLPMSEGAGMVAENSLDTSGLAPLNGEIEDGPFELPALGGMGDFDIDGGTDLGSFGTDPVERLKQTIEDRQTETMAILQKWMEDPETTS